MIIRIIIDIFLAIGVVFALAGTIGVNKMPDTFSRMQAATCISTLSVLCVAIAGILYSAFVLHMGSAAVKIGVIAALVLTVNPIGAHAIMKGAYRAGFKPDHMETDDFRRDFNE